LASHSKRKGNEGSGGGWKGRPALVRLFGYARPFAWLVLLAVLLTVAFSAGRYARAYLMKPILDDVILPQQKLSERSAVPAWVRGIPFLGGEEPAEAEASAAPDPAEEARLEALTRHIGESLTLVVLAAIALIVGMPVAMVSRLYVVEYVLARVHVDLVRDICAKLLALPLGYYHERARGDVLTRTIQDVAIANQGVKLLFGDLIESALMIAIGGIFLFFISWQLASILLVIGPAIFGVISLFSRRIRKSAHRRQEKAGDVTGRLVEILTGIKVIKAFRAESVENAAFRRETYQLFRRAMRVAKNRVFARSLVEMMNNGVVIGMLLLGIVLVLDGSFGITPGDLAAFALVLSATYRPIRSLANDWVQLVDTQPSAERIFAVLDTPEEIPDAPDAVRIDGIRRDIVFRDVSFSYGREPVLSDVSFEVKAGEAVALVGRTGVGKTTIADLLMRFFDPLSGGIEIDGVDLRRIARGSLLEHIAVVTQEPFLFDGSIRENIRYGRIDATDEEILAAARAAYVDEFASGLPEGYDTSVGAAGVRLSGGQRQRITIARALLKNPAILIFDEATSALDSKSEQLVQAAIESLFGGRTVFMIAHRLSTLRRADRIVVLEEGRVSQMGSHEELIREGGLYRELIDLQATSPSAT